MPTANMMVIVALLFASIGALAGAKRISQPPFNVQEHLIYMNYTWAAYCDPSALSSWTCDYCTDVSVKSMGTVYDNLTELYGYVAYSNTANTIIISFRGSSNVDNWLADFDFIEIELNGTKAKVHNGFHAAWSGVRSDVVQRVATIKATLCPSCNRIVNTGHSFGAAVAGLSALELGVAYGDAMQVELHNFGMPRTGDKAFADLFSQHVDVAWRMTHQHDIVPHLPPHEFDFHHVATEVWDLSNTSDHSQRYVTCDGSGEDPNCADSIPVWQYSAADHDLYMGTRNSKCHYDH